MLKVESNAIKFTASVPKFVDPDPITCIIEPTAEEGGLYLGNVEGANNIDTLRRLKIRAVLTASQETAVKYAEEVIHFHEIIQAHDKEDYDIIQHFEQSYEFIDRHRKYTNVFVHCFAGISRSASMVTAYLMKKYNISFEKALWNLKAKRRQVNPNIGFVKQLQNYEKVLKNQLLSSNVVQQAPSRILYSQQQYQQQQQQQQQQQSIFQQYQQPLIFTQSQRQQQYDHEVIQQQFY